MTVLSVLSEEMNARRGADGDRLRGRLRWAVGLGALITFLGALGAGWHIVRQPLSIGALVGRPASNVSPAPPAPTPPGPAPTTASVGQAPARAGSAARAPSAGPQAGRPVAAPRVKPAPAQVRELREEIKERVALPPGVEPTRRQVEGVSEEI